MHPLERTVQIMSIIAFCQALDVIKPIVTFGEFNDKRRYGQTLCRAVTGFEFGDGHRFREIIPLEQAAAHVDKHVELVGGFDAFGDGGYTQLP